MTFRARRARFAARRFDLRVRIAHRGEPSKSGGPVKRSASLLTVAAGVGCSDAFKPTTDNVLGAYRVQTFQTTDTSGTTDWVWRGGTLTITLGPLGTTTGHLLLPGAAAGGGGGDQLLIGDWRLAGHTN